MARFTFIFFIAFYIAPIIALLRPQHFPILVVVALPLFSFLSGLTISKGALSVNHHNRYADLGYFFIPKIHTLLIFTAIYLLLRADVIVDAAHDIMTGRLFYSMQHEAMARYGGFSDRYDARFQIGTVLFYVLSALTGSTISSARKPMAIMLAALFAAILVVESSEGTRARSIIGCVFFAVEFVIRRNHELSSTSLRGYLKYSAVAITALALIFFIPQYARIHTNPNAVQIILSQKLPAYTISMHDAFLDWIAFEGGQSPGFCRYTCTPVYDLISGENSRTSYEFVVTRFGITNIFTNLRGIIADFGSLGSAAAMAVAGAIIGVYSILRPSRGSYLALRVCLMFIMFPIASPFLFTTSILGLLLSHAAITLIPSSRPPRINTLGGALTAPEPTVGQNRRHEGF